MKEISGKKGGEDSSTLCLLPSLFDFHVHFRDFDQHHKETVASGSRAALAGGISAVCDMPNTVPPVADRIIFMERNKLFQRESFCDYLINFCVFDEFSLSQAASVDPFFIKVYLEETTGSLTLKEGLLEKVFMLGKPIALHANLSGITKAIKFSKKYGTRLHICHLSTKEELAFVKRHKDRNITCEATPHHLFLAGDYDVKPPLGNEEDRKALWKELGKTIDIVSSDHAPHTKEDKRKGAFGVSGIETTLPLMMTALKDGRISYKNFYSCMCLNQKRILRSIGKHFGFGVERRADFTLVDVDFSGKIDSGHFFSLAKHSPFDGMNVTARIVETWVRGMPFFKDGRVTSHAKGKEITNM
ncbi:MAG: dihydroorotase [Candidatus Methanofastidiosia archaeon]